MWHVQQYRRGRCGVEQEGEAMSELELLQAIRAQILAVHATVVVILLFVIWLTWGKKRGE